MLHIDNTDVSVWFLFCPLIKLHSSLLDIIAVESDWLPLFVPNMCTFSKPLEEPAPSYDHTTGAIKCHMAATYGMRLIVWLSLCGL